MSKILINLIIMIVLFIISFLIMGKGLTSFIIDSAITGLSSFANILSNPTGENSLNNAMNFIFNIIKSIGLILLYYIVASILRKLILKN